MSKSIRLDILCKPCSGTGLYVGLAERDGAAVVCFHCEGTGKDTFTYSPFIERAAPPSKIKSVHVGRGYVLGHGFEGSDGGLPISEWEPGKTVPADEKLYCPYLYTGQKFCSKPEKWHPDYEPAAPVLAGQRISECKHWDDKADCWRLFDAGAPDDVKRQIS